MNKISPTCDCLNFLKVNFDKAIIISQLYYYIHTYLFWFNFQICSCSIGCGLQCIYYLVINCKLFFTTFYYGQLRHFLWQSHNSLLSNFKFQREHKSVSTFHQVLYQEELLCTYVCIIYIIHFHTKICFCNV